VIGDLHRPFLPFPERVAELDNQARAKLDSSTLGSIEVSQFLSRPIGHLAAIAHIEVLDRHRG
jgi:hypothetical protein